MGTTLRIAVDAPSRPVALGAIDAAFEAVRAWDDRLSTWRDDSELARLNHGSPGQPIVLSPPLYTLLQDVVRWTSLTGGAFDPSLGPLVDAWDLRGSGRIPDGPTLRRARAACGLHHFIFDDRARTVSRTDSAAWLDSGGFGKGVALGAAHQALVQRGVTTASLNFGGQVLALGAGAMNGNWLVPVAHPRDRARPAAWLRFRDRSASTSSQSEHFVTINRWRLGHILDPRTGRPVPPWGSVTVVAEDPALADVMSTALLVLGPEAGLAWARNRSDVAVLFLIFRDGKVERRWNAALEQYLVPDSTLSGGG